MKKLYSINIMEIKDDVKCAPTKKFNYQLKSCYNEEQVKIMVDAFNQDNNIKKIPITLPVNKMKKILLDKTKCKTDICLLNKSFIDKISEKKKQFEIKYNTFRPQGPFKGNERNKWLSTSDINQILFQYQYINKDFLYFGALPVDFVDIEIPTNIKGYRLYRLLRKLSKVKIVKYGFVINLSTHRESGSHWVGLYVDISKNQIYYFDSCADPPSKYTIELMNRFAIWCYNVNVLEKKDPLTFEKKDFIYKKNRNVIIDNKILDIQYNKIVHQKEDSECGVYATNFIIRMIKGRKTFDEFCKTVIPDKRINLLRQIFFTGRSE